MPQQTKPPFRLDDPDFRNADVALRRAAEKAQRKAREAGLEPVVRQPTTPNQSPDVNQKL